MKRFANLLLLAAIAAAAPAHSDDKLTVRDDLPLHIGNFRLADLDGAVHTLHDWSDAKAIVLFIQGNGCPIVRQSFPYLMEIRDEFEPQGVKFALINANAIDDVESIRAELAEFNVDMLTLKDSLQAVAHSLHSQRTAESIVIDPATWDIIYRGEADDRFGYGLQRSNPQHFYLKNTLTAWLAEGSRPTERIRITKGCLMDILDPRENVDFDTEVKPVLETLCTTCDHDDPAACISAWGPSQAEMHTKLLWEMLLMQQKPGAACCEPGESLDISHEDAITLISWLRYHEPAQQVDDLVGSVE